MRRQLTLLLPPEQRAVVEPIRRRLDPRQHAIIQAHVTLCRDDELVAWGDVGQRLADLGEVSIAMRFGAPQVLDDGCVLLRATHGVEQYQRLRQSILGQAAGGHGAHLTLLHPRHAANVVYDLSEIASSLNGLAAHFRGVALIEQQGSEPWGIRQVYGTPTEA